MTELSSIATRMGVNSLQWQVATDAGASQGLWARLKGLFSTPLVGVAQLINVREVFKGYIQDRADALSQTVPSSQRDNLREREQDLMQEILEGSFNQTMDAAVARGDGKIAQAALFKAIARANEQAQDALMELQSHSLRARLVDQPLYDERPQIVVRADQSLQLIRPAPRIENLVLRGGGAKGVGNAPALVEMENAGLLSGLKKIVGTSVGALTAVSIASGQDITAFSALADGLDMTKLRNEPARFDARYPGIDVNWRVGFHGGRTLELLDEVSATSVSTFLNQNWNTAQFQNKLALLRSRVGDKAVARLECLRKQDFQANRADQMITFNDLALMRELDPAKFKELVLTGWDDTNDGMTYFNAQTTPSMPIAVAGRISMSFPIVFKSVTLDPGDGLGKRTFVDGGVGSNMPTEVIMGHLSGRDLEQARSRTAIMTFDDNGEAYDVMHRPPEARNGFMDWILSLLSGNPGYGQSATADKAKENDMGPSAYVIFHGDIGTLDLRASPERVEKAKLMSTLKTLEQIDQRQGQAYAVDCDSVAECFRLLTNAEREALVKGGAPTPFDYPRYTDDPAYRAELELYHLALERGKSWASLHVVNYV
ncbi:patatin-like phospholipase family protein [Ottowia thiooxydans]|uniref:Acylesterase/phospholipase RssA n=1 Tax=Ottowia thiooxydans TaxID=219182 RepID=A0ABV2QET1_9BURK